MIYWICLIIAFPFVFLFFPTKVLGKKYLKITKKKATILSCNHQSNNDVVILKARVCSNAKIMAKNTLFKNKFGGFFLKKFGAYPIDRGGNDISAIKNTLKLLKNNKQLLMFPEGTRVKGADEINVKNGLSLFAIKTDCFIVPMCFRKHTRLFSFNKLVIGKPFKLSDYPEFQNAKTDKDSLEKASKILQEKMLYLKTVNIKEFKKQYKLDIKNINK